MDIISHGLWGSIAFGRKNRRSFWLAFVCGILPDFLAFAPYTIGMLLGMVPRPMAFGEPPNPEAFPSYIYQVYNMSHSLVIFALVFLALWLLFRRPIWEFSAWGLHILVDIPTHSTRFFPTPFLWPVSDLHVNGHSWGDPIIFIPNVLLLFGLYLWFYWIKPRHLDRIDIK
ncbi:hypothetical protein KW797_01335 [Candidatus Parcubacteria bacterium]|nr:hypothetical protein [Candidatus Parcubacteria bacterium]